MSQIQIEGAFNLHSLNQALDITQNEGKQEQQGNQQEGALHSNFSLLEHQKEAFQWMKGREDDEKFPCGILGMVMGLGKTFTTLSFIAQNRVPNEPTLIVCPKTALFTWKSEITKFFGDQLKVLVYRKDETNINEITESIIRDYDIVLTNYEYIRNIDSKHLYTLSDRIKTYNGKEVSYNIPSRPVTVFNRERTIFAINWYRIVIDESHNISKTSSSLWAAMMALCGTRRWCLSGTPIRNLANDIYSQFKWLGYRDNKLDPTAFLKTFNSKDFIHFIDYAKANITLPKVHHERIEIQLYGYQEKLYELYHNITKTKLQDFQENNSQFIHVLTTFLRLRQICVAPYTITPYSAIDGKYTHSDEENYNMTVQHFEKECPGVLKWLNDRSTSSGIDAEKIVKAVDIISKVPKGEKVVVFTMFKKAINLLTERLLMHTDKKFVCIDGDIVGEERDKCLNSFKKDDIDVMFVTYKIGAESLNLTEANHIILLEGWWCPAVIEQAKSRVHRMGQTKDIHIYELIVGTVGIKKKPSIEAKIAKICQLKIDQAKNYLENGEYVSVSLNARLIGEILDEEESIPAPNIVQNDMKKNKNKKPQKSSCAIM